MHLSTVLQSLLILRCVACGGRHSTIRRSRSRRSSFGEEEYLANYEVDYFPPDQTFYYDRLPNQQSKCEDDIYRSGFSRISGRVPYNYIVNSTRQPLPVIRYWDKRLEQSENSIIVMFNNAGKWYFLREKDPLGTFILSAECNTKLFPKYFREMLIDALETAIEKGDGQPVVVQFYVPDTDTPLKTFLVNYEEYCKSWHNSSDGFDLGADYDYQYSPPT
eukprot:Lankesteria_metandrocarpae@DN699_c0_g1_i1.p1